MSSADTNANISFIIMTSSLAEIHFAWRHPILPVTATFSGMTPVKNGGETWFPLH
jgi:hypothetical protein